MRVLVVGTVPPPGGLFAGALGSAAANLVAEGHEVEILSPDLRSAAHRHSRLSGLMLAVQLVRAAGRADALVLRIEPDVPLSASAGRLTRAVSLLALGFALRLYKQVTLRLDSPVPLPGGLGGRSTSELWRHATAIVVANNEDAHQVQAIPGLDVERITVEEPVAMKSPARFEGWDVPVDGDLREEVLTLVRRRAARDRRADAARRFVDDETANPLGVGRTAARPPNPSLSGIARMLRARARKLLVNLGVVPQH